MTADLTDRARAGDSGAFGELTEPYRRELQVHCYRMLGSFQDAEDALQDTLLAAWRGIGGFEGRASLRTWLYRIATNQCLNTLRSAKRRPAKEWGMPEIEPPEPTHLGEVMWLEPYPDSLLAGAFNTPIGPEARYEQTEAISLTFVTALQALPSRQLAILILRDVLGYHADEVADMLDSTIDSVNSALKRARSCLQRLMPPTADRQPPAPGSPTELALVERFVSSYQSGDVGALVALLTDDVLVSMPPVPLEYRGRDVAARASSPVSSARAATLMTWCRPCGQTVNLHSGHLFAQLSASARVRASSSSRWLTTGSVPSQASTKKCSPRSDCLSRFPGDRHSRQCHLYFGVAMRRVCSSWTLASPARTSQHKTLPTRGQPSIHAQSSDGCGDPDAVATIFIAGQFVGLFDGRRCSTARCVW